jgi:hypothetical protein
MSRKTKPAVKSRRKRDPLPPVIKVRSKPFASQLGLALVHRVGEAVTYGGDLRALIQHMIEIRKTLNAAIRLAKAMEKM